MEQTKTRRHEMVVCRILLAWMIVFATQLAGVPVVPSSWVEAIGSFPGPRDDFNFISEHYSYQVALEHRYTFAAHLSVSCLIWIVGMTFVYLRLPLNRTYIGHKFLGITRVFKSSREKRRAVLMGLTLVIFSIYAALFGVNMIAEPGKFEGYDYPPGSWFQYFYCTILFTMPWIALFATLESKITTTIQDYEDGKTT